MKYKTFNNKKGIGIDDAIPIIIFIFVAALVIFVLRINDIGKSSKIKDDIQHQKDILDGHQALMEYLARIDEQGNKADFISKSINKKDYESIKKDMEKFFGEKLSYLPEWDIDVVDTSQKNILSVKSTNYYSGYELHQVSQVASVAIPINGQQYITIKLFFGR